MFAVPSRTSRWRIGLAAALGALGSYPSVPVASAVPSEPQALTAALPHVEEWAESEVGGIRGITVGPIESLRHPGKGYGSEPCARTMDEVVRLGGNWVSLTPFGRTGDLKPTGIDLTFEAPF